MKDFFKENFKIIMYTIFGLAFIMSAYMLIINVHHFRAISSIVTVSEIDNDYLEFKKNINRIEEKLNNSSSKNDKVLALQRTLAVLKKDGVYRLMPNSKIGYHDLYLLNDYFINSILNNCWVSSLNKINNDQGNSLVIELLMNDSKYLESHLVDNGLILFDSLNENRIIDDYKRILNNYLAFSSVIVKMSNGG